MFLLHALLITRYVCDPNFLNNLLVHTQNIEQTRSNSLASWGQPETLQTPETVNAHLLAQHFTHWESPSFLTESVRFTICSPNCAKRMRQNHSSVKKKACLHFKQLIQNGSRAAWQQESLSSKCASSAMISPCAMHSSKHSSCMICTIVYIKINLAEISFSCQSPWWVKNK